MPRLMEKKDWTQMVSGFGNLDRVWQEEVSGDSDVVSLSLPEVGAYRVFLVKVQDAAKDHGVRPVAVQHDWHDIPVSPLVEEITGIIPDVNPRVSYREMLADAICDKYLTGHETVH